MRVFALSLRGRLVSRFSSPSYKFATGVYVSAFSSSCSPPFELIVGRQATSPHQQQKTHRISSIRHTRSTMLISLLLTKGRERERDIVQSQYTKDGVSLKVKCIELLFALIEK